MDGEAWQAAVHGVAQRRTRLKRLSSSSSSSSSSSITVLLHCEISNWKEGSFLLKHHYKLPWIKGLVAIISQEGFPSG